MRRRWTGGPQIIDGSKETILLEIGAVRHERKISSRNKARVNPVLSAGTRQPFVACRSLLIPRCAGRKTRLSATSAADPCISLLISRVDALPRPAAQEGDNVLLFADRC
ncbi:MAG: hypothetical protein JO328_16270 [Hyphomicrobiales bacterium]|nr:hypothetical protein [Hyphomicrobiales bacterium]